ncbi:putative transposase-like protein [Trichonephila clavata]|uniref:Putative transposase-like protein n=1 Tax=Trichonephila clavata TaxID=2740835 RepID=A0A8X6LN30_TRICU|nr:putative transposase-like protein [Trichonephila clavata]
MIESSVNVGGSAVIVEIDESKFGKRKFHRGKRVEDCWKSYDCLSNEGFVHLKVNHSVSFKDPDTGAHTNTIEGTWLSVVFRPAKQNVSWIAT